MVASPALGSCYIIAAGATGAWSGKQDNLACFTAGGWRLVAPVPGMTAYVRSTSVWAVYRSSAWELGVLRGSGLNIGGQQVVGARGTAIAAPRRNDRRCRRPSRGSALSWPRFACTG